MSRLNPEAILSYAGQRRKMVEEQLGDRGIEDLRLLQVMSRVPRHLFTLDSLQHRAYGDTPLPIGENQTISQPYIVARMTEAIVTSGPLETVLEIGTGCGYQTAIIAQLAKKVYTIERIKPLLDRAKANIKSLRLRNTDFKHDDGSLGWEQKAPFDAIIATAAPQEVPNELLQQLNPQGGRLVIPVGGDDRQELKLITRNEDDFSETFLDAVRFVPLLIGQLQH